MDCSPAGLSSINMEITIMSIRKVKGLESDFTIIPNQTVNDKLSWAARGMLLYLCSKPDDWEVCISDLVNQTTGSAKRSGRDAVRKIMDELVECGYMRKTQTRIAGKFQNVDHEVSFVPFTENPYTANPSTVNPTQQSKDLTKDRLNKGSNTGISSRRNEYFINQLKSEDFPRCCEAMRVIAKLKKSSFAIYDGSLSIDEWSECEDVMNLTDDFDTVGYIDWWVSKYSHCFTTKKPALLDMLKDKNGIEFQQFYDSTYLQECE